MKLRTIIASVLIAIMIVPTSASAWWWKHDRETLVDVALDKNDELGGAFSILLDLATANKRVLWRLEYGRQTTVFAPTNQAFIDLLAAVEGEPFCYPSLESIPGWYISDVLNYHLARGNFDSGEVTVERDKIRMLFGGYLFTGNGLEIGDNGSNTTLLPPANIVVIDGVQTFDIEADNGIIHAIDRVVLPYLPPSNC